MYIDDYYLDCSIQCKIRATVGRATLPCIRASIVRQNTPGVLDRQAACSSCSLPERCLPVGLSEDGSEKITGFYLSGEILGLDAISTDRRNFSAVAFEDSEVCVLPFEHLEEPLREIEIPDFRALRAIDEVRE